jgi:outer membrane receptor protein involved in Fe transport
VFTKRRKPVMGLVAAIGLALALAPRAAEPEPPAPEGAAVPLPGASAPPDEEIVVTATRSPRPVRDVPAAVTVVPRAEIERSPGKTADELLVDVPSFALFRRSSSVAADPSSQGVNLRGVGPSGVSRSLVLVDGIPANDPFGGWVYWRAIPTASIERVEVVPGGGSALYGNYALGGVTQVFSRPVTSLAVEAAGEHGSFGTTQLAARGSDRWGVVAAVVEAELFRSDGYVVAAPCPPAGPSEQCRGPIDGNTPSEHAAVSARVEAKAGRDLTLTARGGFFYEDYNGGTRYTTAMARRFEYAASARWAPGGAGAFDLAVFGHVGDFKQDRARVTVDANNVRTAESLAARQDVPTHDLGGSLLWTSRPLRLGGVHAVMVGTDLRRITGETDEALFPATVTPTSVLRRQAGGEQRLYGVFAQDVYDVGEALQVSLAFRYDRFETLDGHRREELQNGSSTLVEFPRRSGDEVSPKLGLLVRVAEWLALRAGAYRSFRAPTLNELYRPFQVGTVRTDANENLGPETLQGAEAGLDLTLPAGVSARATGFWSELVDPIVNVTTGTNLRQRQNLGRARIRGVEADAGWRFARGWTANAAWTFVDPTITSAPGQPQLVGKQLPQDPRHRASLSLAFDDPSLVTANAQLRYLGSRSEDDLNALPMGGVLLLDIFASWHATRNLDVFLAVQNLLDERYLVGRAGVDTVGQPRFLHGGLRIRSGE